MTMPNLSARDITQAHIIIDVERLPEETDDDQLHRGALDLLTRARHISTHENLGSPVERAEALFYLLRRYEFQRADIINAWPNTWDLPVPQAEVLPFERLTDVKPSD